jgi:hypothetical protein
MDLQLAAWRLHFVFSYKLLRQHSANFTGTDNETLRRRTYKMNREAGKQGQIVTARRIQYANVRGGYDFNPFHAVFEAALSSLESDFVAQANISERAEKSVPVTSQGDIAPFAGQSRVRKMTYGPA